MAPSFGDSVSLRPEKFFRDCFARDVSVALPRLRRYALYLTRDGDAADDLVQDTLARGIEKIHLWQPGTDLRAWLFTLLHNLHINRVRRAIREDAVTKMVGEEIAGAYPPCQPQRLELRDVQRGLRKLPEDQRAVLLLVAIDGARFDTAAASLGVPIGTVRSRLSRGRASLRVLTDHAATTRHKSRHFSHQGAAGDRAAA